MISKHFWFKAIAFLATVQLSACVNNVEAQKDAGYLTASADVNMKIDRLIGQTISVRNDVLETIGERGLILDNDRLLHGESILAIDLSEPLVLELSQTPEILVRGEVSRLNFDELEAKYNLNLDRHLYAKYEGKPVIIATSSILSPDPEDLSSDPEKYYGKQLAIEGEVEDIQDYGMFELDEESAFGGEDLLVIQTKSQIELSDEQNVLVFGVLKPFASDELERNYQLDWSQTVKQQMQTEYGKRPILIADRIQPLN